MKRVHRKMVRSRKLFQYMKMVRYLLAVSVLLFGCHLGWCQQKNDTIPPFIKGTPVIPVKGTDTLHPSGNVRPGNIKRDAPYKKVSPHKVDSPVVVKKHIPRKATLYSTFLPGLGQIYNRKYWKLPLVYAAVGIPAYEYFNNKAWYQRCQYAIAVVVGAEATGVVNADSLAKVNPQLRPFIDRRDDNGLRTYRNEYRKDQDYSVLFFFLFWGLNIVDATVDAHLMNFDVSNDLSLHLREGPPPTASVGGMPSNSMMGIGLVLDWHKPRYKPIALP
jgi:hypothetical protein